MPLSRAGLIPLVAGLTYLTAAGHASAEEFIFLGSGPLLGDRARQLRVPAGPGPLPGWQAPDFNDGAAPWTLPDASASVSAPKAAAPTPAPDGGVAPCGALYLRRRFDVGTELSRLASLALRVRYEDGFAAYLNGVEVARRRLPEGADASTLATDRRPVELESYYIALRPGSLRPTNNVLALEVHPRSPERCPRVDAELSAADGARVVRGPYIERVSESQVDLAVESDVPTRLTVRYGRGPSRGDRDREVEDRTPATLHRVRVSGLRAATAYHYQMSLRLPTGATTDLAEASFHTPPPRGRPLTFVVYGDSRSGHDVHARVVQSILAEDPDLVLLTGDVVERGTEEGDWDRFFSVAAPLLRQVAVYLAPGNHDYAKKGQGAARLYELFAAQFQPQADPQRAQGLLGVDGALGYVPTAAPPSGDVLDGTRGYYSFDAAGVHFIALDSNQARSGRQLRWLEDDLRRAAERKSRAIFAFAHEGPWSNGWHGDNATITRDWVPLLERYNVTYYFSGHDHHYERGRRGRLSYLVSGGGGAELRPLRCGAPGKRPCKHTPAAFINDHNYVRVEVLPGALKVCAKRIDGTPLEPCQLSRLGR